MHICTTYVCICIYVYAMKILWKFAHTPDALFSSFEIMRNQKGCVWICLDRRF